jgi:AAA domain
MTTDRDPRPFKKHFDGRCYNNAGQLMNPDGTFVVKPQNLTPNPDGTYHDQDGRLFDANGNRVFEEVAPTPPPPQFNDDELLANTGHPYKQQDKKSDKQRGKDEAVDEPSFKVVSIADIHRNPPPPLLFAWGDRIPCGQLTLLAAHGGTGKSSIALQLAAHIASGNDFLGEPTLKMKAVFFSAEDDADTLRRRLAKIFTYYGIDPDEAAKNMLILDATDVPELYHEASIDGVKRGGVTRIYRELEVFVADEQVFLVIDNASDSYAANPQDRQMVTKFIRVLAGLVKPNCGAALLLAHVNKNTARSGKKQTDTESYADSAAWHNASRSRLFMTESADFDGTIEIQHHKINEGKRCSPIFIRFDEVAGVFTHEDCSSEYGAKDSKYGRREEIKPQLLRLILKYYDAGVYISPSPYSARTNAAAILRDDHTYPFTNDRDGKDECLAIVQSCLMGKLLGVEGYRTIERNPRERLFVTDSGRAVIDEVFQ